MSDALGRRNARVGAAVALTALGMLGVAFAAVPLYDLFCRVTGYNGTVQVGGPSAPGAGATRMTVRFNANTHPGLPWRFTPVQQSVQLAVGEEALGFYTARNLDAGPVTGVATYNVTPEKVGKYFHKTACFCFENQTLAPGQTVDMPLSFWIDPAIATDPNTRDVRTITISYSFFRTIEDAARAGALASAAAHVGGSTATR